MLPRVAHHSGVGALAICRELSRTLSSDYSGPSAEWLRFRKSGRGAPSDRTCGADIPAVSAGREAFKNVQNEAALGLDPQPSLEAAASWEVFILH